MDLIDNVFKRMELHKVCTFILDGVDNSDFENDTYKDRLKKGCHSIYKRLECICQNKDEFDEAVYTEIGMKCGTRLIFQLLQKDDLKFNGANTKQ